MITCDRRGIDPGFEPNSPNQAQCPVDTNLAIVVGTDVG